MSTLVAGWALAVAVVFAVVARLWRADARRPWPLLVALAVTVWTLWDGAIVYRDLIAQHAWTAATIVIPYIPAKAVVLALLAYFTVRALPATRAATPRTRLILPSVLAAALIGLLATDIAFSIEATHVRAARDPQMTTTELETQTARVTSGAASRNEVLAFLENPLCPPALLEDYAQAAQLFKTYVARNPKVPEEIILRLSQDSDPLVRYYAAYSANLPGGELPRLAADTDPMVREIVAWKEDLPDADFAPLIHDSAARVRAAAALQPRMSDADILELTRDPDSHVRANATRMAVQRGLQDH